MNKIDNSQTIFEIAKSKFEELAKKLEKKGLINKRILDEEDGISLQLFRKPDNKYVFIKIHKDGEVFHSVFDDAYIRVTSAEDMDGKLMALNDLLTIAQSKMENRNYYEEIYEQNGKIIYRRLVYPDGIISASTVFLGRLRRFLGAKKRIVRPEPLG